MARACTLLLFYTVLVYLAIEDFQKRKISDWCHAVILSLALIALAVIPEISFQARILGMFAVSLPMTLITLCFPGSFGGGDVKLAFSGGAFLGWELVLGGTAIAICLAGLYSLWVVFIRKEKKSVQFALGPYLSMAYIIATFALFQ